MHSIIVNTTVYFQVCMLHKCGFYLHYDPEGLRSPIFYSTWCEKKISRVKADVLKNQSLPKSLVNLVLQIIAYNLERLKCHCI